MNEILDACTHSASINGMDDSLAGEDVCRKCADRAVEAAVRAEREACAKAAVNVARKCRGPGGASVQSQIANEQRAQTADEIGAAIRARGGE